MIEAIDLVKRFDGVTAVDKLNRKNLSREVFCLLGPGLSEARIFQVQAAGADFLVGCFDVF